MLDFLVFLSPHELGLNLFMIVKLVKHYFSHKISIFESYLNEFPAIKDFLSA